MQRSKWQASTLWVKLFVALRLSGTECCAAAVFISGAHLTLPRPFQRRWSQRLRMNWQSLRVSCELCCFVAQVTKLARGIGFTVVYTTSSSSLWLLGEHPPISGHEHGLLEVSLPRQQHVKQVAVGRGHVVAMTTTGTGKKYTVCISIHLCEPEIVHFALFLTYILQPLVLLYCMIYIMNHHLPWACFDHFTSHFRYCIGCFPILPYLHNILKDGGC